MSGITTVVRADASLQRYAGMFWHPSANVTFSMLLLPSAPRLHVLLPALITFFGIVISFSCGVFSKTYSPIVCRLSPRFTSFSRWQPLNAEPLIVVTLSGIVTDTSDVPANAESPIVVSVCGNSISFSAVPLNALEPML